MFTSLLILPLVSLLSLAFAEDLQTCGVAFYYPSKYTCFPSSNNLLCPKTSVGEPYIACGAACYDAGTYYCDVNSNLQLVTPLAEEQWCGSKPYKPGMYTCFPGDFLCPVLNGEATLACGGSACYNPREYSCMDGRLGTPAEVPLPQGTCRGLYEDCFKDGQTFSCCEGYWCSANKCRPFNPAAMVKKSLGKL